MEELVISEDFLMSESHCNNAVIAELVLKPSVERYVLGIRCDPLDICLAAALCRKVELVALVGELCDTRHINGRERLDLSRHLQRL